MLRKWLVVTALGCAVPLSGTWAAEMSVGDLRMRPKEKADVVVSGGIDGESTFGWTIMLQLTPRADSRGTLRFTPEAARRGEQRASVVVHKGPRGVDAVQLRQAKQESVDILQLEDAWPEMGTFTAYDTQLTGSETLNGAVDDNGTYLPEPVSFSGRLASFPVTASPNARGVWDVTLVTTAGASNWEGLETNLISGMITVARDACMTHHDCIDRNPCTDDTCEAGVCRHVRNEEACQQAKPSKKSRLNRNQQIDAEAADPRGRPETSGE